MSPLPAQVRTESDAVGCFPMNPALVIGGAAHRGHRRPARRISLDIKLLGIYLDIKTSMAREEDVSKIYRTSREHLWPSLDGNTVEN
jgi:hypothetical protein